MKSRLNLAIFITLLAVSAPLRSFAITTVGGISFDDNAFADTLISSSGSFTTSGGSLASVLVGSNPNDYAFSFSSGAYVQMGFTDNVLVNGPGNDLALFELGVPDSMSVALTIGGTTNVYTSSNTGFTAGGFQLNVALANLDDFGIAANSQLSSIVIGMDIVNPNGGTVPSLAVIGALNSAPAPVPEPYTVVLAAIGLCMIPIFRRRVTR